MLEGRANQAPTLFDQNSSAGQILGFLLFHFKKGFYYWKEKCLSFQHGFSIFQAPPKTHSPSPPSPALSQTHAAPMLCVFCTILTSQTLRVVTGQEPCLLPHSHSQSAWHIQKTIESLQIHFPEIKGTPYPLPHPSLIHSFACTCQVASQTTPAYKAYSSGPQGTAIQVECGQVNWLSENLSESPGPKEAGPRRLKLGAGMPEKSSNGKGGLKQNSGETASYNCNFSLSNGPFSLACCYFSH